MFVFSYAVSARAWTLWLLTKSGFWPSHPQAVPPDPDEGQETVFAWKPSRRPPLAPWMNWSVEVSGQHARGRDFRVLSPLAAQSPTLLQVRTLRGRYRLETRLILKDAFGFCRWSAVVSDPSFLLVRPRPALAASPSFPETKGGFFRPSRRRHRGEALLEARPYVPGDDVRRLHWRLWAHVGQPFIRVSEDTPPPTGLTVWVFDTSVPEGISSSSAEHWLDQRAAAVLGVLKQRQLEGRPWILALPDQPSVSFSGAREADSWSLARNSLAAATAGFSQLKSYRLPLGSFVLVSGPGCPGLESLAREARSAGRFPRPFVVPGPVAAAKETRSWWLRRET